MSEEKHEKYALIRKSVYKSISTLISNEKIEEIVVDEISTSGLQQISTWRGRLYQWDWFYVRSKFRKIPARF